MTLGQRIQEHRLRLELSQEALGERLGVSRQAVSKWEADAAVPDTDKLIALSKLFGLTLNELLQVEGPEAGQEAENAEETPRSELREEEKPGKKKMHAASWLLPGLAVLALVLGLTAMVVSFGRTMGQLSDRIARLELRVSQLEATQSAADLENLVADCKLEVGSAVYSSQMDSAHLYRDVTVTVSLSRTDLVEEQTVFFQVYGAGAEARQVDGQAVPGTRGVYSAQVPVVPGLGETIAVVIQIGGTEYLQPLARISSMSDNAIFYDPLLEQKYE